MQEPFRRSGREPVFNMPALVIGAIVLLLGIHGARQFLSPAADFSVMLQGGFIPAQWSVALDRLSATDVVNDAAVGAGESAGELGRALANVVLGPGFEPEAWAPFTYAGLHASWTHAVLNCVWLAAFATPVVRRAGIGRSVALAILTAFAGAFAHWLVHPAGVMPLIGASAIVSGFMAAAATFIFDSEPVQHLPSTRIGRAFASLERMSRNRTALIFLGSWVVLNFLSSVVGGAALGVAEASIAWEAHLGGFLVGLLVFPLIDPGPSHTSYAA